MSVVLAMILFSDEAKMSSKEYMKNLETQWGVSMATAETTEEDGTIGFGFEGTDVVLAMMPVPIPGDDLVGPSETSVFWSNASEDVKKHKSHMIVTVLGVEDPVEASTKLSQIVASVLASHPSAQGVYWSNAALLLPKDLFIEFATDSLPEEPPLHMWVDYRVGWADEKHSAGFTTGMEALGHMEIEVQSAPEKPSELRDRLLSLAEYLIKNGPVIGDGNTIGGEGTGERIMVEYSKSNFGYEDDVMVLKWVPAEKVPVYDVYPSEDKK